MVYAANVEIQLPHGRTHAGRATIVDGNWNSHRAERKELSGDNKYRIQNAIIVSPRILYRSDVWKI
jgi:hypothetical protein